jgi:hypothetical protein
MEHFIMKDLEKVVLAIVNNEKTVSVDRLVKITIKVEELADDCQFDEELCELLADRLRERLAERELRKSTRRKPKHIDALTEDFYRSASYLFKGLE